MTTSTKTRATAKAVVLNALDSGGRRLGDRDLAEIVVNGVAADDVLDARDLLDILGLVDWSTSPGMVRPEDRRLLDIEEINGGKQEYMGGRMGEHQYEPPPRRYVELLPPGLRISAAERAPAETPSPPKTPQAQCGTHGGRRRHQRAGEPICEECRVFYNAWKREYVRRRKEAAGVQPRNGKGRFTAPGDEADPSQGSTRLPPSDTGRCGSMTGRSRHIRAGELLCRACKDAANADAAKRRKAKAAGKPKRTRRPPCGSAYGARSHRRHGEPVCEPCRLAQQEADRRYGKARRARETSRRQEDAA